MSQTKKKSIKTEAPH